MNEIQANKIARISRVIYDETGEYPMTEHFKEDDDGSIMLGLKIVIPR